MRKNKTQAHYTEKERGYLLEIFKANIIAIAFALIAILLAALVIKLFNVTDDAIPIINQVIKSLAIFIGCILSLKKPNNGWLRGILCGISFALIAYVVFSMLNGNFDLSITLLNDCAFGALSGMISGIIAVNIHVHHN